MKKDRHISAFYLETLLLIIVFIAIIMVLTRVFGQAQLQSTEAKKLTEAVTLAGSAAEAVSSSATVEDLLALLNENGNAVPMQDRTGVTARYGNNLSPEASGDYRVDVVWYPDRRENGTMITGVIQVWFGDLKKPIYTLETESFRQEVSA